jgi:hypothetical protein
MIGRRVMPDADGCVKSAAVSAPGSYGRSTALFCGRETSQNWWQVTAPDGSGCTLNPSVHAVTEHEDGTITVHPSIVTSTWHGWLERGVWRSA